MGCLPSNCSKNTKKFETKKIKIKFFHFIEHKHNQKKATKMTLKIQICEKSSLPFLTKIFSFINFNYKQCYQMKLKKISRVQCLLFSRRCYYFLSFFKLFKSIEIFIKEGDPLNQHTTTLIFPQFSKNNLI